ncbi:uncharacterized protein LOC131149283 isoform X2 [Malania oleifera]|uniref:uncharacterized protein LOC131149283 isoform X2 n=1 Tax=Malania oleifera TaxID=397392 RepID=UPI0025AE0B5F|nr:uncharacterized protein LOC131149283 isoform X2 [Malania oleifera]
MTLNPEPITQEGEEEEDTGASAHHPSPPPNELFDVSTTVDPSYLISLIRKLLPSNIRSSNNSSEVDACDALTLGSTIDHMEESIPSPARDKAPYSPNNKTEPMGTLNDFDEFTCQDGSDEGLCHKFQHSNGSAGEQAWEEFGCILWDLAVSRTHAEFMVQNLLLDVLLANLMVSQSMRITEISLGIIGNLACHEVPMKHIVSTNGLIEIIVDQLFVDDTPCLCEACRLLTLGLQGSEGVAWAEALQFEHILSRLLWIAENTLNLQLIEKSIGLVLAIIESQQEVKSTLLATMMKLGFLDLLINLLSFEMSKLMNERIPERYAVLELILRAIEALSVIDEYSKEICSKKELFIMVYELVRFPDKVEVANSCVTAAVLIANILIDAADLVSDISQDVAFLQGLLDVLPFSSDDLEARSAIWSIMARVLVQVDECKMSPSSLHQYVLVLVSKSELIEDDLLNQQLGYSNEEHESLTTSGAKLNARNTSLKRIISILNQWIASKDYVVGDKSDREDHKFEESVVRLLDCFRDHVNQIL